MPSRYVVGLTTNLSKIYLGLHTNCYRSDILLWISATLFRESRDAIFEASKMSMLDVLALEKTGECNPKNTPSELIL